MGLEARLSYDPDQSNKCQIGRADPDTTSHPKLEFSHATRNDTSGETRAKTLDSRTDTRDSIGMANLA